MALERRCGFHLTIANKATHRKILAGKTHLADESSLWPNRFYRVLSHSLPKYADILLLVEEYFALVHPLRMFGFIHKPTFLQKLEDQSGPERNRNVLLLVVCALGAKYVLTCS